MCSCMYACIDHVCVCVCVCEDGVGLAAGGETETI